MWLWRRACAWAMAMGLGGHARTEVTCVECSGFCPHSFVCKALRPRSGSGSGPTPLVVQLYVDKARDEGHI